METKTGVKATHSHLWAHTWHSIWHMHDELILPVMSQSMMESRASQSKTCATSYEDHVTQTCEEANGSYWKRNISFMGIKTIGRPRLDRTAHMRRQETVTLTVNRISAKMLQRPGRDHKTGSDGGYMLPYLVLHTPAMHTQWAFLEKKMIMGLSVCFEPHILGILFGI